MEQIATTFRHVVVIVLFCQSAFYCDSLFRERQKLRSVLHVPLVPIVAEVASVPIVPFGAKVAAFHQLQLGAGLFTMVN